MSWPMFWLKADWRTRLLTPLAKLVAWVARRRLARFRQAPPKSAGLVLVVGNIVVGGAGKTPFIQWLGNVLTKRGLRYGVISRGYGGQAKHWPQWVDANSEPSLVGDEPVLLAQRLACPVVVSPKRDQALDYLLARAELDIVISDDGLQHYALARDIEVVLLDASRPNQGLGNGLCLPAGPLREPVARLAEVDFVVFNGSQPSSLAFESAPTAEMTLVPNYFYALSSPDDKREVSAFAGQCGYGLAGIGNPARFFQSLSDLGIQLETLDFADHHAFSESDFKALDPEKPVFMTAKDAVKCRQFARPNWWVLEIDPQCSAEFEQALISRIMQQIELKNAP